MSPKPTICCHVEVSFICPCKQSHGERQFMETSGTLTKPASILETPPDITHFVPRKIIQCSDCERKWHPVDDRKKLKLEVVEWYIPYSVLDNELNENASLLTRLRIEKGLSMEALAKEMGVTKPTIISYEKGRVRQPQQVVIEAYAKRFGLSREAVIKAILWRKRE